MAETTEEEIEVNFRLDRYGRTQNTTCIVRSSDGDVGGERNTASTTTIENLIDYNPKTTKNDVVAQFVATGAIDGGGGGGGGGDSKEAVVDDDNNNDQQQQLLLLDELLYDCEISDCGLMPRTYWVPASTEDNFQPRFSLEQMALDVFQYHTRNIIIGSTISDNDDDANNNNNKLIDMKTSGAEWWVQIRPSPEKTGRYSMLDNESSNDTAASNKKDLPPPTSTTSKSDINKDEEGDDGTTVKKVITTEDDLSKNGISFHWDKDEDLRLLCGGTTHVHPHLSTVTYLTHYGAPTIAFNYRVNNLTGEYIDPNEDENGQQQAASVVEALVSWPLKGKHLSFDGRFLHAAPSDLMEDGKFEEQCKVQVPANDDEQPDNASILKRLTRRHRRVTFLVNIWLNYHPFDVKPFPGTMVDKMSGSGGSDKTTKRRAKMVFPDYSSNDDGGDTKETTDESSSPHPNINVTIKDGKVVKSENSSQQQQQQQQRSSTTTTTTTTTFIWPMGDCGSGETIRAAMPLNEIRSMADCGGNVKIRWCSTPNDVQLLQQVRDGSGANANDANDTTASNNNKRQKVE